jgi:lipoyl-dependent peroxiredoxin
MVVRVAEAEWQGDLNSGQGRIKLGSGAFAGSYSYPSRFESAEGTNPEELLGAAEAGCFSMALSLSLTRIGHPPKSIHTTARVHFDRFVDGFAIDQIELETVAEVRGLDPGIFHEQVALAKHGCPISEALSATKIVIKATLNGE